MFDQKVKYQSPKVVLGRLIRHMEKDSGEVTRRIEIVIDEIDGEIVSRLEELMVISRKRKIELRIDLAISPFAAPSRLEEKIEESLWAQGRTKRGGGFYLKLGKN